jgi:hypothetical protein
MVCPGAGKGASMTLRMNGYTRAGDISLLFSTSSRIYMQNVSFHYGLSSKTQKNPITETAKLDIHT